MLYSGVTYAYIIYYVARNIQERHEDVNMPILGSCLVSRLVAD